MQHARVPRRKLDPTDVLTTDNLRRAAAHLLRLAAEFETRDGGMFSESFEQEQSRRRKTVWSTLGTEQRLATVVALLVEDENERTKHQYVAKAANAVDTLVSIRKAAGDQGLSERATRRLAGLLCIMTHWAPTPAGLRRFQKTFSAPLSALNGVARTHTEAVMVALGHFFITSKATIEAAKLSAEGKSGRGALSSIERVQASLADNDIPSPLPFSFAIHAVLPVPLPARAFFADAFSRLWAHILGAFKTAADTDDESAAMARVAAYEPEERAEFFNRLTGSLLPTELVDMLNLHFSPDDFAAPQEPLGADATLLRACEVSGVPFADPRITNIMILCPDENP